MGYFKEYKGGILIAVHCQPRASCSEFAGLYGDAVKLRLKAPPVDGKANEEAIKVLSRVFGVPRRHISLKTGQSSRKKTFYIGGIGLEDVKKLIEKGVLP